jgi:Mce-associated membrane protein
MEGDAGSGQLTPTPPLEADETVAAVEPEAGSSDQVTEVGADGPESRLATGRWVTGIIAAVLGATVLLAGAGVLAWVGHRQNAAAANDDLLAVAAAKDCITATQAPDVKAMKDSQRKIIDCATENYVAQANLYSGLLAEAYQAVNAQVKIVDMRAAPERHNDDGSIDVLVATRVSMSNIQQQDQELSYRLRVRMMRSDGTFKIDNIEPVSK